MNDSASHRHGHGHGSSSAHDEKSGHGHAHGSHGERAPESDAAPESDHAAHGGHAHGHGGHAHGLPASGDLNGPFAIAVVLNVGFALVEFICGLFANSTALVADAAHNLSDVLGLLLAWGAARFAKRKPSDRYTYGLRRSTVLAALGNAVLLLVAIGGIAREAWLRLSVPASPAGGVVLVVALVGVVVNGSSALLFSRHAHSDLNVRGAFLHLVTDAIVSLAVVAVGGIVLWRPSLAWLDPAVSLVIGLVILSGTWDLLKDSLHLSMDGVPSAIDLTDVKAHLRRLPGVVDVHDLHVWSLSTSESALTAHLVVTPETPRELASRASHDLADRFGIQHVTLQLDGAEHAADCRTC
ncbi:MAG TPA: cation diffusion facilitator family transporter [Polyangiaceae bacterium]|nr:cation diffusion facilitator family transporter [Polyangiaceae bacterium]